MPVSSYSTGYGPHKVRSPSCVGGVLCCFLVFPSIGTWFVGASGSVSMVAVPIVSGASMRVLVLAADSALSVAVIAIVIPVSVVSARLDWVIVVRLMARVCSRLGTVASVGSPAHAAISGARL